MDIALLAFEQWSRFLSFIFIVQNLSATVFTMAICITLCKMLLHNAKIILARVNIWDIQPKNSPFKVGMINA
ncbi:hypothetical protein D8T33_00910 [Vibrio vulnificus]|nr:hypothetical protein D8T33_00910 [Vibrio vulnificus]